MKKTLVLFSLLIACVAMFAQSGPTFPYQAVVRNSQNQLIKDSTFVIDVAVYQDVTLKYSETQNVTTNANGQFTMNIGGGAVVSGALTDITDWSVAKFQITYHLSEGDIVSENAVNPVPYALQAANATSAASGNFLTSDSAVITTMQGNITTNTTNIATNTADIAALANRVNTFNTNVCDSVKDCNFSGNASIQNMLQELSNLISAQNHKIDSLAHLVDSLSNLPHGGGGTPTVADGQPCPGTATVSDVDGNTYNTVKIGNQCWMKENLRTKTHQYGTVWTKTDVDSTIYGRYYDWQAAMQIDVDNNTLYSGSDVKHQGICPEGWHVPSYEEWDTLTTYVNTEANGYRCDGDGTIAKALSRPTGWSSNTGTGCNAGNTGDKANATGFAAVPAGYCFFGDFYSFGYYAYFWSATQDDGYNAGYWRLRSDNSFVASGNGGKDYGFSVRCLRDAGVGGTPGSNETGGGTNPSTPGEVSCEQVMECMADTLSRLNARITSQGETIAAQGAEIETLNGTVTTQGETITAQGETIDSLAHIVDSLSNITPVTPVTPTDTFNCGTDKVKDADNNEYNTVKIGNQCWTKENLKTTSSIGATYYPDNQVSNVATYGLLYDWAAAMQDADAYTTMIAVEDKHQGICPTGWHVPSQAEWDALTKYTFDNYKCDDCGGSWAAGVGVSCIAKALASPLWTGGEPNSCSPNTSDNDKNATGFSALPAGGVANSFESLGNVAGFWSTTQYDNSKAYARGLVYNETYVSSVDDASKVFAVSVRCLRDAGIGGGDEPSEPSEPDTPVTPTDTFNCGTDKVKDAQNNEYNTVQIGNQCWTKENLRTNVGTGDYGYPTGVSGTADTVTYGRLYSWAAVMSGESASSDVPSGVRGICPEGWHVPSDGEWGNLINYVKSKPNEYKCGDDANNIANALSSETGWTNGSTPGCNAGDDSEKRNQTGFSAVPAGYFGTNSTNKGTHTYFWSATDSGNAVYYRHLDNTSSSMNSGFEFSEDMGLSVRCLRN